MGDPRPKSAVNLQSVSALMQELKSPDGFDPVPPDQHKWMMDPNQPPLQRMWAWMIGHTVHWGHRTAYATHKRTAQGAGSEAHLENIAEDLEMDAANSRRYWRIGVERGIWRNGTEQEGPRRLYLTGRVPTFKPGDEAAEKSVQTCLPIHIQQQINGLPDEKRTAIRKTLEADIELEKSVQAALIAANRAVFIERQDSILAEYGVKIARQEHQKRHETPEEAEARRRRIEPIRAPIQEYVQTVKQFVQCAPRPMYKPPEEQAKAAAKSNQKPVRTQKSEDAGKAAASLLPVQRNTREIVPRSVDTMGSQRSRKTPPVDGKKPANPLPTLQPVTPLSESEKQAERLIYSEILRMQQHEAFQHMEFTREQISSSRKSDRLFVYRVIAAVGPDYMEQFLRRVWVQLERLDRNALGKLPGRAPAPRSLGLILMWALEYGQKIDEAAKMEAAQKIAWHNREVRACQEIIADAEETAEAKDWARKFLEGKNLQDKATA